jgi:Flp pilus assembly protein TadD
MNANKQGMLFANRGDYEKAIDEFSESIRLHPESAAAYILRGKALMASISDVDNRREDFNSLRFRQLKREVSTERIDEATADYTKVIELNPNDAQAYKCRGDAYSNKDNKVQAQKDYNRAMELDPN